MKTLSPDDLIESVRTRVTVQAYGKKLAIEGVKVADLKQFNGEDGIFEEILRFGDNGMSEVFPDFSVRQVNRSKILPQAIKAWHVHMNQEDIWYVPADHHVLLGVWDVRETSATRDMTMRIILGGGISRLVYIPRGVAHGVVNLAAREATLFYFVNQQFNQEMPDEYRIAWNAKGAEFWTPEKG